jgi:hypothetical protein
MMDLEGSERYLIEVQSRYFLGEHRKATELRIASDQTAIGTRRLPNASV